MLNSFKDLLQSKVSESTLTHVQMCKLSPGKVQRRSYFLSPLVAKVVTRQVKLLDIRLNQYVMNNVTRIAVQLIK